MTTSTWSHATVLMIERTDHQANVQAEGARGIRPAVFKNFRWRIEQFDGRPRVVAEHQQQNGKWAAVRHLDQLAQLLAATPGHEPAQEAQ